MAVSYTHLFALQHAGPDVEPLFSIPIFWSRIFAIAGADQGSGVFGNIKRLLQMPILYRFSVSQFTQKIQCELPETGKAIRIFFEVAEHVVVLGAEIIVAAIFGENQRIEEQAIAVLSLIHILYRVAIRGEQVKAPRIPPSGASSQ